MCDPRAVIMGGLSAASSVRGAMAQQKAVKKQEAANNQWMAYQRQQRVEENARQEQMRQQAEAARQGSLQDMDPTAREKSRTAEETRLDQVLQDDPGTKADESKTAPGNQADVNAALLSGQATGAQEFTADLASRVSKATQDARTRIKALAGVQSFGGTVGGMQTTGAEALQRGDQGITLANDLRRGSLSAYGAAQAVDPIQYNPTSNPWGGIANALAGIAGQRGGFTLGKA